MDEIKPCPFCGGEAEMEQYQTYSYETVHRMFCPSCKMSVRCGDGTIKQELIEAWNTRCEPTREKVK